MRRHVDTTARIDVTVNYDGERVGRSFDPDTSLREVERWAADALEAPTKAPHRLALRHTDTVLEPNEDKSLADLDRNDDGDVRFDLHVEALRFDIIVNGQPRTVTKRRITFSEVVELAGHQSGVNIVHTVTYRRGPRANPEGTMVRGDSVKVKDRMVFNVTSTDKS